MRRRMNEWLAGDRDIVPACLKCLATPGEETPEADHLDDDTKHKMNYITFSLIALLTISCAKSSHHLGACRFP